MTRCLAHTPVIETERLALGAPTVGDWPHFNAMMASGRANFIRTPGHDLSNIWRGPGVFAWQAKGCDAPPRERLAYRRPAPALCETGATPGLRQSDEGKSK